MLELVWFTTSQHPRWWIGFLWVIIHCGYDNIVCVTLHSLPFRCSGAGTQSLANHILTMVTGENNSVYKLKVKVKSLKSKLKQYLTL